MNPRPVSVMPLQDYQLLITFQNGEKRIFDVKPLLCFPLYAALKNENLFRTAQADGMCIFWNDEIDLCPDTCYLDSTPASPLAQGHELKQLKPDAAGNPGRPGLPRI